MPKDVEVGRRAEQVPGPQQEVFSGVPRTAEGARKATEKVLQAATGKLGQIEKNAAYIQQISQYPNAATPLNILGFISDAISSAKDTH